MSVRIVSIPAAAISTPILEARSHRKGAIIQNDSAAVLRLAFGDDPASTDNFTAIIDASASFEMPTGFNGAVQGVWSDANGSAKVTEWI